MKQSPHIYSRSGSSIYWVKKRVPKGLSGSRHPALLTKKGTVKEFLSRSTGTADRRAANKVANGIVAEWDALFDELTLALKAPILPKYDFPFDLSAITEEHREYIALQIGAAREYYLSAKNHPNKQYERIDAVWNGAGDIVRDGIVDKDDPLFDEYINVLAEMDLASDFEGMFDIVQSDVIGFGGPSAHALARKVDTYLRSEAGGLTLEQVVNRYMAKREADNSRPSHLVGQRATIKLFASLLPQGLKTPIAEISGANAVDFAALVASKWQVHKTRQNKLSEISSVFNYARKALKEISANPFDGYDDMLPRQKTRVKSNSRNRGFTGQQLCEVLNWLSVCSKKGRSASALNLLPAAMLAAYTGMRLEEISRIKLGDLKNDGEYDYLDITESKSEAGERRIPLNRGSRLVLAWLRGNKVDTKSAYLIEGLSEYDNRRSKKMSDTFSRWKADGLEWAGVKNEYTFHSFRSTAATCLDRADLPVEYQSLIIGHVDGRNTLLQKVYSEGKRMDQLVDAAQYIDYGDDVLKLCAELLSELAGVRKTPSDRRVLR